MENNNFRFNRKLFCDERGRAATGSGNKFSLAHRHQSVNFGPFRQYQNKNGFSYGKARDCAIDTDTCLYLHDLGIHYFINLIFLQKNKYTMYTSISDNWTHLKNSFCFLKLKGDVDPFKRAWCRGRGKCIFPGWGTRILRSTLTNNLHGKKNYLKGTLYNNGHTRWRKYWRIKLNTNIYFCNLTKYTTRARK